MELDVFGLLGKSENQARIFFKKNCWKNGHVFCTRCRSYKIYRIVNKRYRCKRCGYTFHDFSNRWINKLNISFKHWLWLIKLFELDISTRKIADQVRLSYPTVLKATTLLRVSIYVDGTDDADLLQEGPYINDICYGKDYERKEGNYFDGKVPVIGIKKKDGMIRMKCIRCEDVDFNLQQPIKNNKIDSFLCDAKLQNYDYLMCCDYKSLKLSLSGRPASSVRCGLDGIESFLSYAKERLLKFHGISKDKFALYLKEIEFRYNHRQDDLFILFIQKICALLPFQMSTH
jgi:transposase